MDPANFALAAVRDGNVRVGEKVIIFGMGAIGLLLSDESSYITGQVISIDGGRTVW